MSLFVSYFQRPTNRGNIQVVNKEKETFNEFANDVISEKNKGDNKSKVDISNQITDQLISELGDKNWKVNINYLNIFLITSIVYKI